jgi:RNA polymerase sigma-70 factor, ECF subfamily
MPPRTRLKLIQLPAEERREEASWADAEGPASEARQAHKSSAADATAPLTLEAAFRQYAPHVAAVAFRILGSRDEMQDLVQDVFLRAHDWMGRIQDPRALKSWLTTVTVREARLRLRVRRVRTLLHFADNRNYGAVASSAASPAERALTAEIYAILDDVSVEGRLAWTLRYVEGLTLPEIAQHCSCSLATVKRRVARVQQTVLEALGDGHP